MDGQKSKSDKWKEVKEELQKTWGLLTHDEIEKAKGSLHSLASTLQKKYGLAKHEAEDRLRNFVDRLSKAKPTVESEKNKKSVDQTL